MDGEEAVLATFEHELTILASQISIFFVIKRTKTQIV